MSGPTRTIAETATAPVRRQATPALLGTARATAPHPAPRGGSAAPRAAASTPRAMASIVAVAASAAPVTSFARTGSARRLPVRRPARRDSPAAPRTCVWISVPTPRVAEPAATLAAPISSAATVSAPSPNAALPVTGARPAVGGSVSISNHRRSTAAPVWSPVPPRPGSARKVAVAVARKLGVQAPRRTPVAALNART